MPTWGAEAGTTPTTSSPATGSSPGSEDPLLRLITGYRQDDHGDWVAELDCLHRQHVRHRPPFQERSWVTTEEGRRERLGTALECPLCDRCELPDALDVVRTLGPFDRDTWPEGLRREHRVPAERWGRLRVLEGDVGFSMATEPPIESRLAAGEVQVIPPEVPHAVRPEGPCRLEVELLARRGNPADLPPDPSDGLSP